MEEKTFASSSSQPNMISPSSSFKPKLNDQEIMELVCENGQILAKSRRPKNNGSCLNRRTRSLLDLYEFECDEGLKKNNKDLGESQVVPQSGENNQQTNKNKKFKSSSAEFEINYSKSNKRVESSTLIDNSLKGSKNVEVETTPPPPDEQSAAVGRSTELYFACSSMLSSRDQSCYSLKRKYGDIEAEESTYLSNNSDDDETDDDAKTRVLAKTRKPVVKRKRSTEVHKLCEKKRRNEMNKKMRALQELLPNCYKDDKVSLLDEAIKYMKTLQLQLQMMSMGNGLVRPPTMMLPMGHYSPMSLGMHMGPQFLPQGTGFPGINNAPSPMLNFLNHPTGLVPNPPMFSPLDHSYSPQFVVPSCVPHTQTQATSITQFPRSSSNSNLEDVTQFRASNGYYHSRN